MSVPKVFGSLAFAVRPAHQKVNPASQWLLRLVLLASCSFRAGSDQCISSGSATEHGHGCFCFMDRVPMSAPMLNTLFMQ